MSRILLAATALACLVIESSCVKYQPHELSPVKTEAQFRARTFEGTLDPESLTKFALQSSPDLEAARAKVAVAEAALVTAHQRTNPSLAADGGYNRTTESASTYSVSAAFTIETAGKRGYRILEAEKLAEAARIAVYEAEWQVRSRVRAALVNYWAAQRKRELLERENGIRAEIAAIYEKRVALGEAANPELTAARTEQATLELDLGAAEGEQAQALAAVADAVGLPVSAVEGKPQNLTMFSTAAPVASLPLATIQKAGLLHRADIRRALIEYEAADAKLRLALANQYPNITLSPSYVFQEGFPAYTLGSVLESLPVFHRNKGPITEQEATLRALAAQFSAQQAKIIGETESALRRYTSSAGEYIGERDTLTALQQQRIAAVTASFNAGESDRLDVAQARLAGVASERSLMEVLVVAQTALGALEDAVQSPLAPPRPETTN